MDDPRAGSCARSPSTWSARSVWIVGGDGWAYDIGYGGLDHVLASGRNVNILVLDTEVYSNTGGQASKSTPRGAVAKFAAGGKQRPQEGSRPDGDGLRQRLRRADRDGRLGAADASTRSSRPRRYDGPSLIIAYSHCIAHGINMRYGMRQQKLAVDCGHWPLYRYRPAHRRPRRARSSCSIRRRRSIPLKTYAYNEIRYKMLSYTKPERGQAPARARAGGHRSAVARLHEHGRAVARGRTARPGRGRQPRRRTGVGRNGGLIGALAWT